MAVLRTLTLLLVAHAATASSVASARGETEANPIRKVVTMLQSMHTKVVEEGKKAEQLFDKFMCYCQNADGTLGKSIAEAEAKIPQLEASIKEAVALKAQLEADIKQHQADRADAKAAIAAATALRKKEAGAFAAASAELKANIAALTQAIAAIEKGVAGGFLQTRAASVLRRLTLSVDMSSTDRDMVSSFLAQSGAAGYIPQSAEIVGILKQMKDEMEKDLADATAAEESSIADYKALVAAKTKEIEAATQAIEDKLTRVGDLGVEIATSKNDLEDTTEGLGDDKKFLADLDKTCTLKKAEWAEYQKTQALEIVALLDTIKLLNSDDALELFKKTLPSAASFLQMQAAVGDVRRKALAALARASGPGRARDARLDLLEMALHGQKGGFEKIIKMIDDLVALLKKEQEGDDTKKEWCAAELDTSDDTKKSLEHDIEGLENAIADAEEALATTKTEIEALEDSIKALDKQVAEATDERKAEHDAFVEHMGANNAAVEILAFAKNRLNKFYNPKLYVAPPKEEPALLARVAAHAAGADAPPPPPEADLSYKKKGEAGTGVIAMIDLLVADLEKEITEMETDEKDAQEDYEGFISDSAAKRATDSKALTDKEGSKAALEEELVSNGEALKGNKIQLMETEKYVLELHQQCDWLLEHFDLRKEARAAEVDSLISAKAVLNGADFSL